MRRTTSGGRGGTVAGLLAGALVLVAPSAAAQVRVPVRAPAPLAAPALAPGAGPNNAKATATSPTTVTVTWDAPAGVRGYLVQRRRVDNAACCTSQSGSLTSAGWNDGGLEAGVEYMYSISVLYADGRSGSADVGVVTPLPVIPNVAISRAARMATTDGVLRMTPCAQRSTGGPSPQQLTGVSESPAGLHFNWVAMATGTNYVVERSPEVTTSWTLVSSTCGGPSPIVAGTNATGQAAIFSRDYAGGVQPNGRYIYRVTAVGPNGEAGWNTIHWKPPCGGSIATTSVNVTGSTVTISARYTGTCISNALPMDHPGPFVLTTSYGFTTSTSTLGGGTVREFRFTVYGVPVGTHIFTIVGNFHKGGQTPPWSSHIAVAY